MNFYTNVRQYGNSLLVRGIDSGKRIDRKIEFSPILFEPSREKTGYTSIFGDDVAPVFFDSMKEAKDYLKQYEGVQNFDVYGNASFAYQYITEKYGGMAVPHDSSLIKVAVIDIETESEEGFPRPDTALEKINLITISFRGSPVKYVFGTQKFDVDADLADDVKTDKGDINYWHYKNEQEMLQAFVRFWNTEKPDVVTGWNCKYFDMPYLINRITRVLNNQAASSLSPWNIIMEKEATFMGREQVWYDIYGVETLDYIELYMKFTFEKRERYTLDHIGEVELKTTKLKHSTYSSYRDIYTYDWKFWTSYNIVDVEIVEALEDKLQLIELAFAMAYDSGCNFSDVFSPVRVWDTIIYNYLFQKKIVLPQRKDIDPRRIEGAYVQEPEVKGYEWVVSFDATSLYPSIIMQFAMSPENIVGMVDGVNVEDMLKFDADDTSDTATAQAIALAKSKDLCLAANGSLYKKKMGVFPELVQRGFSERMEFNKQLKAYKKEYEVLSVDPSASPEALQKLKRNISRFHVLQLNKKILLNSLYGAMANAYFRLGDYRIAEGITLTGQYIIRSVGNHLDNYLNTICGTSNVNYVIYKDTDSVVGESVINVNGEMITIADLYERYKDQLVYDDPFNRSYVAATEGAFSLSFNTEEGKLEKDRIRYVMKHRVKKRMFRITCNDRSVVVTEDHSIIVKRNGRFIDVPPQEIKSTDKVIRVLDIITEEIRYEGCVVEDLGVLDLDVYDIEMEKNHNFVANGLVVHNSVYVRLDDVLKKYTNGKELSKNKIVDILDKFCQEKLSKEFDKACRDIFEKTNSLQDKIIFKREVIADRGIWTGKKRYALNVYDSEGVRYNTPDIKIMGMESVRSSTPAAVRAYIKHAVKLSLQENEQTLQQYIREVEAEFMQLPPEKIAFPRGLSGLTKYAHPDTMYKKGTPIATRAALLYNHYILDKELDTTYQLLREGDKMRFIYLRLPNPIAENIIGFPVEMPEELGLHKYVDYPKMFEKAFLAPLQNIMYALRWSDKEVISLDDIF